jgi:antitoxin Phd
MANTWSLQDAKARFSELVNSSLSSGAQVVTRHGQPAVIVLPVKEYERLSARKESLADFLASAPRVDLFIERSQDEGRKVEL